MGALIPIAIQLAQFAPALMRYFGAGQESAAVAEQVVEVAKNVSGASTPEAALEAIKASGIRQMEFQKLVMENDAHLNELYLADTQDARKRDVEIRKLGMHNVRADALTLGAFLVIALICYKVWNTPDVPEWVKAVVMLVLGRFLGYMDQIFQFEFGATRNSTVQNGSK